ncbi:ATP-binding sensor histidine kinase [Calothrix sp. PCC 7507]|uniref:trifunctional serine/threonine-protein kinase/ATP-binding protein/sensor histidine kinase n=1 Tax=Calothrix sp. PCC 7507 TaxID=99598 RepID=UPI00029F3562|nr:ATP-binding sensor histidine kinase [Calothrix sp. PCC 7507]AFY35037.1 multi-sensor signal transduction multi-kinase [Calothrix sp. PCC 7507]
MTALTTTAYPIHGYRITEQIYASNKTLVYRAIREQDQQSVILKLMRTDNPNFTEIAQFRNQYTITRNLNISGIVKPLSLESYHNGYALVMEDFGGISLKDWQIQNPVSLNEFFPIAIAITTILEKLHCERIIHKDIKPANILIHPTTGEIRLIDFSLAALLPKGIQYLINPNVLEGTLAYISPEQTGRMNRGIDYRSDFYSLGITFFELLTGILPFSSNDPMELVYSHLAKQAPKVSCINSNIPTTFSDIISKLIAKNAEERYQSSQGLKHDLEICQKQWQATNNINAFQLGLRDLSHHFVIPEKLYGRQNEVETLIASFQRVRGGKSEIALISGFSGVGKTSVINEVHKQILSQRSYFIKGKFDQFQRNIPLSALVQALRDLVEQILLETDAQLHEWQTKILAALGTQGYVITEIIPELEKVISKQPPVAELSGSAHHNRFNLLLYKFIHVFTSKEHPLVIFLDDLQWADIASLKFIELLMNQSTSSSLSINLDEINIDNSGLLVIGAYRNNEVSHTHPLYLALKKITQAGINVYTIYLPPLTQNDLNKLITDTLCCRETYAVTLTQMVFAKTKGNPFFATQFLKSLHDDGLILLNYDLGYWQYNISEIQKITLTDDVLEFIINKIKKTPTSTQELLKLAACIGNEFDLKTLAIVYKKSLIDTVYELRIALLEGLILFHSNSYNLILEPDKYENISIPNTENTELLNESRTIKYRFVHDRIQQAAYSLISQKQKKYIHLKIAVLLLSNTPIPQREEKILEIVNQFNIAVELITDPIQRHELAAMNLTAGRKALASTAYSDAVQYLTIGMELLQSDCWDVQYQLTLALHETAAEATYLSGNFKQMEQLIEIVLIQAKTLLDRAKVYEVKVEAYKAQGLSFEAIKTGIEVLNLLGMPFPEQPTPTDIAAELQKVQLAFVGKKTEDIVNLPHLTDPTKLTLMRMFGRLLPISYASNPLIFSLIALKQVNLSFIYGNCDASSVAYAVYAVICWNLLDDFRSCYRLGQLALNLLEIFHPRESMCITIFVINNFTIHWQEHLKKTLNSLINAYSIGLETGDLEQAAYSLYMYSEHSFFLGKNLLELEKEMSNSHVKITQLNQEIPLQLHAINWQTVLNLLNSENLCCLDGKAYNEQIMLPILKKIGNKIAIFYLHLEKLFLCYLFENYSQAWENANCAKDYLDTVPAKFVVVIFYFYSSLSALGIYPDKNKNEQKFILELVSSNQQKIKQWAGNAPMNFLHKFYLVEAELNRVIGNNLDAMEFYDRAIALAQKHDYIHEAALANELAAKFYLQWDKQRFAKTYMVDAYYGYVRWGALAKVQDLQNRYSELLPTIIQQENLNNKTQLQTDITIHDAVIKSTLTTSKNVTNSSTTSISDILDLEAVIKAYQLLSEKIELQELISKLIELVMENAGASKCVLILNENNNSALTVTAVSTSSHSQATHTEFSSIQLESSENVPITVINYVKRTQEILVIDDTEAQAYLATDIYIKHKKPKSLLCIPMINQKKLLGILYLENNLATRAFTRDRLEVLKLLITQAAISLENAMLYRNLAQANDRLEDYNHTLEEKVAARTTEIYEKNQSLQQAIQELKFTQTKLIQTEKMSSLGQMVAGIAHEINNPINFIHANLVHTSEYVENLLDLINTYQQEYPDSAPLIVQKSEEIDLEFLAEDLPKILDSMKLGSIRIRNIILSLRNFSRLDEAAMKPVDIHEGIDNTLMLLQHRIKKDTTDNQPVTNKQTPEIIIIKEYGHLPLVTCYASQLNQVFMNILNNAIDALEESTVKNSELLTRPQIRICTELVESHTVRIRIFDNGLGIPEAIKEKIFDPFFTTKPIGSGTGLGLSISYQIVVEKHRGKLSCSSTPKEGTEFFIDIPLEQPEN